MKVRKLSAGECSEIMKTERLGRLACSKNGQPYIVPFHFAYERGEYLYAFSILGQKIHWMRENPLVCVEIEHVEENDKWATLIIFGRYEELPDEPKFDGIRAHAHELLASRPNWWKPAYAAGAISDKDQQTSVYFRIFIESVTGHGSDAENADEFISAGPSAILAKRGGRGLW